MQDPVSPHCLSFASKQLGRRGGFSPALVFPCLLSYKAFPAKGTEQAKVVITWPQCLWMEKGFISASTSELVLSIQAAFPSFHSLYCPPGQLGLLDDPFSWTQVPFVQRGGVPASISKTLWNIKFFPTRFNIRTIKYLKIKGFFFPPYSSQHPSKLF